MNASGASDRDADTAAHGAAPVGPIMPPAHWDEVHTRRKGRHVLRCQRWTHCFLAELAPHFRFLTEQPGTEILEVGCAPGRFLGYFHQVFGWRVAGIDRSEPGIARTRRLLGGHLDFVSHQPLQIGRLVVNLGVVAVAQDEIALGQGIQITSLPLQFQGFPQHAAKTPLFDFPQPLFRQILPIRIFAETSEFRRRQIAYVRSKKKTDFLIWTTKQAAQQRQLIRKVKQQSRF